MDQNQKFTGKVRKTIGCGAIVSISLFLILPVLATAGDLSTEPPPAIFVDQGVCPSEACYFRRWLTVDAVTLWDKPMGKEAVATLRQGETVDALTGDIISKPRLAKADQNVPGTPIKKGDSIYILHYNGETYWTIWYQGERGEVQMVGTGFPKVEEQWWVKVRDQTGKTGWALGKHFRDPGPPDYP